MNKQPLFSVGEEVILFNAIRPELNGEYVIQKVLQSGDTHYCRLTGVSMFTSKLLYILDEIITLPAFPVECGINEELLRKKYPPSTESFKEMMSRLTKVTMYNQQ